MQYTWVFIRNKSDLKIRVMTNEENIIRKERTIDAINDKITVFEVHKLSAVKIERLKKKRDHYLVQLDELKKL